MDNKLESTVEMRGMMKSDYADEKYSKENELNESMSIKETAPDEYENTIMNIGGNA